MLRYILLIQTTEYAFTRGEMIVVNITIIVSKTGSLLSVKMTMAFTFAEVGAVNCLVLRIMVA
jgi:hypothetical protein